MISKTESQTRCHVSGCATLGLQEDDENEAYINLIVTLLVTVSIAPFTAACQPQATPAPVPPASDEKVSAFAADVAHLKDITPSQSHTMIDVGYHMSNLWFAAQQHNWDLAAFEEDETRNRIRWTIRINPTRKKPDGELVDIKGIFDGIRFDNPAAAEGRGRKEGRACVRRRISHDA